MDFRSITHRYSLRSRYVLKCIWSPQIEIQRQINNRETVQAISRSVRMLLLIERWISLFLRAIIFTRARYYNAEVDFPEERIMLILAYTFCLDSISDSMSLKRFWFTKRDIQKILNTITWKENGRTLRTRCRSYNIVPIEALCVVLRLHYTLDRWLGL